MSRSRIVAFLIREFREIIPPTVFFAIGFNLVWFTTQLILDDYKATIGNFMLATTAALVVGKAVLVANALPFLRRFDTAPLIQPILFKTVVYWAVVFVVRILEKVVEYSLEGGKLGDMSQYLAEHLTWHRFAAIQIWILVLFLIYTFVSELNTRLGGGELAKLLFARRSSEPQLNASHNHVHVARDAPVSEHWDRRTPGIFGDLSSIWRKTP